MHRYKIWVECIVTGNRWSTIVVADDFASAEKEMLTKGPHLLNDEYIVTITREVEL